MQTNPRKSPLTEDIFDETLRGLQIGTVEFWDIGQHDPTFSQPDTYFRPGEDVLWCVIHKESGRVICAEGDIGGSWDDAEITGDFFEAEPYVVKIPEKIIPARELQTFKPKETNCLPK